MTSERLSELWNIFHYSAIIFSSISTISTLGYCRYFLPYPSYAIQCHSTQWTVLLFLQHHSRTNKPPTGQPTGCEKRATHHTTTQIARKRCANAICEPIIIPLITYFRDSSKSVQFEMELGVTISRIF